MITFLGLIVLFIWMISLNKKVGYLEDNIETMRNLSINSQSNNNHSEELISSGEGISKDKLSQPYFVDEENGINSTLWKWMKENWIMKLGALLLLMGLGWLTVYAFANNWIGDAGRISLGIILGAIFLVIGTIRIKDYQNQGEVFLLLGSTTILLTTFAARVVYGFFDPLSSLALMFLSVAFVAFVGVKHKSKYLPLICLILAGIAPLLTNSTGTDYFMLFTYLLVVVLGVIWVVAITGQRNLVLASLVLVFLHSMPCLLNSYADLLVFAYIFTIIFFISNIVSILKSEKREIGANMLTAGISSMFLLSWVLSVGQEEFKVLILTSWMMVFAVGAFLVFRKTGEREPFYVYALSSVVLLAAATALQFGGETLLVAYTLESMVISIAVYLITRDLSMAKKFTFLLVGPAILSLGTLSIYLMQSNPLSKEFYSLVVLIAALFLTGLFFWNKSKEMEIKDDNFMSALLVNVGAIYSYIVIWICSQKLFDGTDIAITISLTIFTLVGIGLYLYGVKNGRNGFRRHGQVLVAFVVLRLLLVDVSNMEIGGKIVTFLLIGVLLISTAFLEKQEKIK
jgi:uncharacterized membrane protein